jgi:hypothetical protein
MLSSPSSIWSPPRSVTGLTRTRETLHHIKYTVLNYRKGKMLELLGD